MRLEMRNETRKKRAPKRDMKWEKIKWEMMCKKKREKEW